jgi:hypothetical protein
MAMPNVTAVARDTGNGELTINFVDTISTVSTTYTFPKQQHNITVKNKGTANITVTINATPYVVNPGQVFTQELRFTAFSIVAASGIQAYEVTSKLYTTVATDSTPNGLTAERPTGVKIGYMYYDTTLSKPIWHNGNNVWKDAAGTTV